MKEIWRPVVGLEEYFKISNLGRIKRIKAHCYSINQKKIIVREMDKILKPTLDRGYLKINLSLNGKRCLKYIHRLVAEAFIPNPNNYKEVNHIDSNPTNNHIDNLEWCDRKYNIDYMLKHQEQIRETNEMKAEALENIYYGIEMGTIKNLDDVKKIITKDLLY